jgi:hypothetical protein
MFPSEEFSVIIVLAFQNAAGLNPATIFENWQLGAGNLSRRAVDWQLFLRPKETKTLFQKGNLVTPHPLWPHELATGNWQLATAVELGAEKG